MKTADKIKELFREEGIEVNDEELEKLLLEVKKWKVVKTPTKG